LKAIFVYSFLRLLILGSFLAVGYLIGLRGITLLVVSFLSSGIVSLFVLNKKRDQLSSSVFNVFKKVNNKIDQAAKKED
jgi:hypothetical protein